MVPLPFDTSTPYPFLFPIGNNLLPRLPVGPVGFSNIALTCNTLDAAESHVLIVKQLLGTGNHSRSRTRLHFHVYVLMGEPKASAGGVSVALWTRHDLQRISGICWTLWAVDLITDTTSKEVSKAKSKTFEKGKQSCVFAVFSRRCFKVISWFPPCSCDH